MSEFNKPDKPLIDAEIDSKSIRKTITTREQKLAKQLRENLAKRKKQSKVRNTKPRNFKKLTD